MAEEIKGEPSVTAELKNTIEKTNWWNDGRRDDREKKKSAKSIEFTQSEQSGRKRKVPGICCAQSNVLIPATRC